MKHRRMDSTPPAPRAYLVETLPAELYEKPDTVQTGDTLVSLIERATRAIAIAAMYWSLLPGTAAADEDGLDQARLHALGARRGEQLYAALTAAAQRGVRIRVVQSANFAGRAPSEAELLAERFPGSVAVRVADMRAWYGDGTMHQKFLVVDERHLYLGSANMDWRALSEVKELGVVVENDPQLGGELARHFETWWQFAALPPHPTARAAPGSGFLRPVPPWSVLHEKPAPSPLPREPVASWLAPLPVCWNGRPASAFFAASPPALCSGGRIAELDALLQTIATASERLDVSVMNFLPLGTLPTGDDSPPERWWWPPLFDALLHAAARGTTVRLLASRWAHTAAPMLLLLAALQATAAMVAPDRLAVRLYTMPGWDQTMRPERRYPAFSRVNHPKFAVTDARLHLSTSNMAWRDFFVSGGVALNTDHPDLVSAAQAIFDRDWGSSYTEELPPQPAIMEES